MREARPSPRRAVGSCPLGSSPARRHAVSSRPSDGPRQDAVAPRAGDSMKVLPDGASLMRAVLASQHDRNRPEAFLIACIEFAKIFVCAVAAWSAGAGQRLRATKMVAPAT